MSAVAKSSVPLRDDQIEDCEANKRTVTRTPEAKKSGPAEPRALSKAGIKASILGIPPGMTFGDVPRTAQVWVVSRFVLLALLLALPFGIYWADLSKVAQAWYAPFMGIVACALPSGGAPVAGGIVFLPLMTLNQICPQDAVAFSAAVQTFGCGVFAPMGWIVKDRSVFLPKMMAVSMAMGTAGLLTALLIVPAKTPETVNITFTIFCAVLVIYTAHGLIYNRLNIDEAPKDLSFGAKDYMFFFVVCFSGGFLTGYIGIAIEKFLFVLLTWRYKTNVRAACISSITVVGWLSGIALLVHALSPRSEDSQGYIGAIPYPYWLMAVPGVLMGSIVGPWLNSLIGPRRVMIVFCVILATNTTKDALGYLGVLDEGSCRPLPAF